MKLILMSGSELKTLITCLIDHPGVFVHLDQVSIDTLRELELFDETVGTVTSKGIAFIKTN